eukprot:TRINITY_DN671_c0_g1_i2.p2 TRINITY_DN671_c0_g1~~TRINITY_DN671_c0_g1_i2.p2  ORF type:complete len:142 (-),score=24.07 TRINITY_DN671_c0_g1_i2:561-986(-)
MGDELSLLSIVFANVASSVLLVTINKSLFNLSHWNFHFSLLACHMICSSLCLYLKNTYLSKKKEEKEETLQAPQSRILLDSIFLVAGLYFMNKVLHSTNLTFFQCVKISMIPLQGLLQQLLYGNISRRATLWLFVVFLSAF